MSEKILAWHFSTGALDFDYKGTKIVAGLKLTTSEKPVLKYKGFHASTNPFDALKYFGERPNPADKVVVSRVQLSGKILSDGKRKIGVSSDWGDDVARVVEDHNFSTNIVAQNREHLWVADAKSTCEAFGAECYRECLRLIQASQAINDIFAIAIDAREQGPASLDTVLSKVIEASHRSPRHSDRLSRLAMSLTMNTIPFLLTNVLIVNGIKATIETNPEAGTPYLEYAMSEYQQILSAEISMLFHNQLMQLAPTD